MRILHVSQNHYVAGGMDRVMFDQAHILTERGHDVIPFTASDPADVPSPWAEHFPVASRTSSTPLADVPATLYRTAAARSLERLLSNERFDIVHLHSWFKRLSPSILPVLARAGVPVVQTLHDYRSVCSRSTMFRDGAICRLCAGGRRWPAVVHRCNGSLAKSVVSVTEMEIADRLGYRSIVRRFLPVSEFQLALLRDMGMPEDRMRVLPNPVLGRAAPPPLDREARPVVLFAGRLENYKGVDLFVDLALARPAIAFAMAGDGSARARIEARKPPNLRLLGQLDQAGLIEAMNSAACIVAPSLCPETFGLSAAEAMAMRKPVIASRTGGLTEIVRNGVDGYLADPGDLPSFIKALDRLLADPKKLLMMGENGRKRVADTFSEDRFYSGLMAIYHEVFEETAR